MCLPGPLAALSPVSMIANKLSGKGLLGKEKKKKPAAMMSPGGMTTQGTVGPSPSYYGG